MKNLKISQKLMISFGTILLISIILVILSISALRSIGNKAHDMYTGPYVEAGESMSWQSFRISIRLLLRRSRIRAARPRP